MSADDIMNVYELIKLEKVVYNQYKILIECTNQNERNTKKYKEAVKNIYMLSKVEDKKIKEYFNKCDISLTGQIEEYFGIADCSYIDSFIKEDESLYVNRIITGIIENFSIKKMEEMAFKEPSDDIDDNFDYQNMSFVSQTDCYLNMLYEYGIEQENLINLICSIENTLNDNKKQKKALIAIQYNICFSDRKIESLMLDKNFNFNCMKKQSNYILNKYPYICPEHYFNHKEEYEATTVESLLLELDNEKIKFTKDRIKSKLYKLYIKDVLEHSTNQALLNMYANNCNEANTKVIVKELKSRGMRLVHAEVIQ